MMTVFAVRDVKSDAFGAPIVCATKGLAMRSFQEACLDKSSPMAQYPEDFSLYEIGTYEANAGRLTGHPLPQLIVTATEILAQVKRDRLVTEPELPGVAEVQA